MDSQFEKGQSFFKTPGGIEAGNDVLDRLPCGFLPEGAPARC
ncbi:MAG TPA: hypothetical protein VMX37_02220 [Acidimicrobiia bacterium]|nr:hypothetical protein [Acidimicrobiia bacterium]